MALNPKLKALPLEQLFALRDELVEACKARRYEAFRVGNLATFEKSGRAYFIRITGLGPKNIQGTECDENGLPAGRGSRWTCAVNSLTPVFPKKAAPKPVQGTGADRPQSAMAGSF